MKKIVAILLVVALMSAMFVVPAHAHEGEEATPYSYACTNRACARNLIPKTRTEKSYFSYPGCTNNSMTHNHYYVVRYRYYVCNNANCSLYNVPVKESEISRTGPYCIYD